MIKLFTTRKDFDSYRNSLTTTKIGLVPTMGNLHDGHMSLLAQALKENDAAIVTIYVNPKQFGPNEDFDKYPRTLDADLAKISSLHRTIDPTKEVLVFAPISDDEVYPKGFKTNISITGFNQILEGAIRPTHFDGVSTVVYRLFKIARAHNAYFGQKDFQQVLIIKKMVRDLELDININVMPIIRSSEGLALSSRNQYLSDSQKKEALIIINTITEIKNIILSNACPENYVENSLKDSRWDYIKVLDADSLDDIAPESKNIAILAAFRMGETRLIDNVVFTK